MKNLFLCSVVLLNCAMAIGQDAPNGPGMMGVWSRPDKQGLITSKTQPLWATIAEGVLTEVHFPFADRAQTKDTQILIRIGQRILEERKHFTHVVTRYPGTLAYHVTSVNQELQIRIEKDFVPDPQQPSLWVSYRISMAQPYPIKIFLLHNPAADNTAGGDAIFVRSRQAGDRELLAFQSDRRGDEPPTLARRATQSLVLAGPTEGGTVGFEGVNGPYEQLLRFGMLNQTFTSAKNGNVAGALILSGNSREVSFHFSLNFSLNEPSIDPIPFLAKASSKFSMLPQEEILRRLLTLNRQSWESYLSQLNPLGQRMEPHVLMLKGLEDKFNPGALIAGLAKPSLPERLELIEYDYETARLRKADINGGYHRVWPRDLAHMGIALLAAGDTVTPINVARFLQRTQKADGSFWQNTWVDGQPSWLGYQMDQTGLAISLVSKLVELGIARYSDFRPMVLKAADSLLTRGPITDQERWEENGGLSPNSIAAACQGLLDASWLEQGIDQSRSQAYGMLCEKYKTLIFDWTYIDNGPLGRGYFERLHVGHPQDRSHSTVIQIRNNPVGGNTFLESEIVDGGFLHWIFTGLLSPLDPRLNSAIATLDRVAGPIATNGRGYLRYNHDGYGQGHLGRPWPLLAGERALAAIARGEDPTPFARMLFGAADARTGIICEQIDGASVCPLGWSHAEALIVARSMAENRSFYMPRRILGIK
ncbi:MAG: hypothetical protein IT289_01605 [Oligoflexia bacterium]|nr:hypothetical protein [Oligoflexia bacterium]